MSFFDNLFRPEHHGSSDPSEEPSRYDPTYPNRDKYGPIPVPPPSGDTGSSNPIPVPPPDPSDTGTPPPADSGTSDSGAPAGSPADQPADGGAPDPTDPDAPPAAPVGNDDDDASGNDAGDGSADPDENADDPDAEGAGEGDFDDDDGEGAGEEDDSDPPADAGPDYTELFGLSNKIIFQQVVLYLDKKGKTIGMKAVDKFFQEIATEEAKTLKSTGIEPSDDDIYSATHNKVAYLGNRGLVRLTIAAIDFEGKYVGELEGNELNIMMAAFAKFAQAGPDVDPLEKDLKEALSKLSFKELQELGQMMSVKPARKGQKLRPADFLARFKNKKERKRLLRTVDLMLTNPDDPDDDDDDDPANPNT